MRLEISRASANWHNLSYSKYSDCPPAVLALDDVKAELERSGKICLKPWCWRLFCILFQPPQEPPWLSSWWSTPTREKQALFQAQLEYLARHTDRLPAACRFLQGLDRENWLFTLNK